MTYHGGILCTFWANWYNKQVHDSPVWPRKTGLRQSNTGELVSGPETLSKEEMARNRTDLGAAIKAHPMDDQYHIDRSTDLVKDHGSSVVLSQLGRFRDSTPGEILRASHSLPRSRSG